MTSKDEQIRLLEKQVADMQEMYIRDVAALRKQLDESRAKSQRFIPLENQERKVRHV